MKRNYILSLLAIAMLMPFTALKAQYDTGDSTVCYNIMTNNFTTNTALNWSDPDPGNWLGVIWNTATPKRIVKLELHENGNDMGSPRGGDIGLAIQKYTDIDGSGVNSELTGALDFSALTELFALDLRRQEFVTSINVTGLNNLEYFMMSRADNIATLDFSNLANLQHIHVSRNDGLTTINASNCPRLKKLMVKQCQAGLTNVNVLGSDSIRFLNLKRSMSNSSPQTVFDLTGKFRLYHFVINEANISSFTGLSTLSQLTTMRAGNNNLTGTININDFDSSNFYRLGVSDNELDAITGWTSQITNSGIDRFRFRNNHLTLNNAIQVANEVHDNASFNATPHTRYGGDTIPVGTTLDYTTEALIDINGVNVASTFRLYAVPGGLVSTNSTGIFTFPTVGEFYIEMENPGAAPNNRNVQLTTDNFWVVCTSATGTQTLSICAGDTTNVNGMDYSATGMYYNYYNTAAACDSVYITDLTVEPAITSSQSLMLCNGTPYTIGTSTYTSYGVYNDILTAADGCDSTVTTHLDYLPAIDASVTVSGQTLISNNIFVPTITYQWIDCGNGNAAIAGATNSSYTPNMTGSYAVVSTEGGCSDTSSCYSVSLVGISENVTLNANIYPNPISNQFTIELGEAGKNTQISIVNVEGKIMYDNIINTKKVSVDGTEWSNGVYIVRITNNDYTKTYKLIK